ncbi:hypothetical protein C8J57DRAFT_1505987 [Mycena rebaudengoi]|nr:hypothetical protein C8J57DRAFT_1505987 [Mycena rebaudengoi]
MARSLIQLRFSVYCALLKWHLTFRAKHMGTGYTKFQRNQVAELSARKALTRSLLEYHDAVAASPAPNLGHELSIYRGPAPTIYTAPASFGMNFRHLPIPVFHKAAHRDRCWDSTNGPQSEIARFYHELFCQPLEIEVL